MEAVVSVQQAKLVRGRKAKTGRSGTGKGKDRKHVDEDRAWTMEEKKKRQT